MYVIIYKFNLFFQYFIILSIFRFYIMLLLQQLGLHIKKDIIKGSTLYNVNNFRWKSVNKWIKLTKKEFNTKPT